MTHMKKDWVAEMFALDIENISSYTVEKTFNLWWGMSLLDEYELWQEIVVVVYTKKPVFEIGKEFKTCKLESRVWARVPRMEYML